jgi:DNA-binding NarL/FixJ family response regulator
MRARRSNLSYRIYLADDHILVREGLKMILAQRPDYKVAGEASDGFELLSLLKRGVSPDAVILDISMPKLRGIEAIREIKDINSKVKVLVLTMHKDEEFLCQAFIAGVDGYLLKEDVAKELFSALDAILRGEVYISSLLGKELKDAWIKIFRERKGVPSADVLSAREKEVLKLVAEGESNKQIGERLCISARTVDHHRAKIMEKLNLKGTADLIRYAITKGYLS